MSFPLTVTVDPAGQALPSPFVVTVTALGEDRPLDLVADGDGLSGTLELPAAPRYVRMSGDCTDGDPPHRCLDQLVFMSATDHESVWFTATGDGPGLVLERVCPSGHDTLLQLGWGAGLLLVIGLLWLQVGSRARA